MGDGVMELGPLPQCCAECGHDGPIVLVPACCRKSVHAVLSGNILTLECAVCGGIVDRLFVTGTVKGI
jgi:hypothetical protein